MPRIHRARRLAPGLLALAAAAAAAQTAPTVLVTANPLGSERIVQPSHVLAGEGLALRRAGTFGETLDGLPGVASTAFGPNAGRPVLRGLDGDRVRLLDNGGASVDASSLSFDHAFALEPLVAERVEVLRGPAALLYGGSATGGVVNVIHNRVPRAPIEGLAGRAELRAGGAASERAGVAVLEGGAGRLAWHADAFGRRTRDLRVPRFTPVEGGEALEPSERVRNSAARAEGGALGAGWVGEAGHLGAALETYRNRYGVTSEEDVTIRMQRERGVVSGQWRRPGAAIDGLAFEASRTRYRHEEVEGGGEVGTTFASRGDELRAELRHAPIAALGGLRGAFGVQAEDLRFSALGEEAFVPGTRTRSTALFVLEEITRGALTLSGGVRVERARVASDGDVPGAGEERFGAARERRFTPRSAALGARFGFAPAWEVSGGVQRVQRAPASYELYANGLHLATAAFERGDPDLGLERSTQIELGLRFAHGASSVALQLHRTRFANFIALDATGATVTLPGEGGEPDVEVPEYAFGGVRARLSGIEIEGRLRLLERPATLDLLLAADALRGDNLARGEPLPRIAPRRVRMGLEGRLGAWRGGIEVSEVARQTRVPATDSATPGYTRVDLWAGWQLPLPGEALLFARVLNAGDELAYSATTIATLRGLAPLAGRSASVGLRWRH